MHGDFDNSDSVVLLRDDYERYSRNYAPFISVLTSDLMSKAFLFLGFSFSDPNFSYVISQLRVQLENSQREHYCILKQVSKEDFPDENEWKYRKLKLSYFIEDLKRFGIKTLLVDEYSKITEFLQEVKRRYNRKTIYISGAAAQYEPDAAERLCLTYRNRWIN